MQGVALSASRNNIKAVIVMPLATPQIKVRRSLPWRGCRWLVLARSFSGRGELTGTRHVPMTVTECRWMR